VYTSRAVTNQPLLMKAVFNSAIVGTLLTLGTFAQTGSNSSTNQPFVPGGTASVGLTNIVPDVLLWYDGNANHYTNGPVNVAAQEANLGNWEPYISAMGDSTFLIAATTFADDQTAPAAATATAPFQRFVVTFQPASGGPPKIGEEFFTDAGAPFRGVINLSRENGNPDRVAGDKRPGATNFITAAETSAGQLTQFQSDSRWSSNAIYQADNRYVTVQPFSLDPTTLTQAPAFKAFDAVYGNYLSTTDPSGAPQVSRTGGTVAGLDNGNFVVVIDDKTSYTDPNVGEVTTFAIVTPTGSVVKSATEVDPRDIWDNVAAYKGGFAVRVHDMLYFYDNSGKLQHSTNIIDSSTLQFGTGREDGSRIGANIASPYVFLAGQTPESGKNDPVNIAVWDSRTGAFVTSAMVSDTDPTNQVIGRVTVDTDGLDNFCVAYMLQPTADFTAPQVAARVGHLSGTNITFLTSSFFPFVNYDKDGTHGITTSAPSVAMTTRAICIAAKGTVNSANNPNNGADTAPETTLYTVINNPAAQSSAPAGQPVELGQTVNGFQDDFTGATRDPNWVPVGPGGDLYTQTNGVLQVAVNAGDPNHLLYMGPGGSNTVQEVLARIRVVAFGSGDPCRGGVCVGSITNLTGAGSGPATNWSAININIRNNADVSGAPNYHFRMLDDLRAWGPQYNLVWTNNVWYWMRLSLNPKGDGTNDYFGKVWLADGVTPEPSDWQMKWSAATATTSKQIHFGYAGITGCSAAGLAQTEVDYILIKSPTLPSVTVNFAPQGPDRIPPEFRSITRSATNKVTLDWFGGTLQQGNIGASNWVDVANTPAPYIKTITNTTNKFYRIRQ
jgi:hypothetical protein